VKDQLVKIHPVANLFPLLAGAELQALADDIAEHGLQEAIVMQGDVLLDGRNRLAACKLAHVEPRSRQYEGKSPIAFVIGANLKRRHLDASQKAAIAVELEPYFAAEARERQEAAGRRGVEGGRGHRKPRNPGGKRATRVSAKARDQAAGVVGVSGKLVGDAKAVKEADPEAFEAVKAGKIKVSKAKKNLKAKRDKAALAKAQETIGEQARQDIAAVCDLRVCSCEALFASGVRPDAVITDPPYPREFLPVFSELAEACKAAKVPLVAVMSGQTYLPEVLARLCRHLRYRWTLAYLTPGGQAVQQFAEKVNAAWKPVLLFGEANEWLGDVATSKTNDNDKRFHGWGQSESGMADLVERLTKPDQLVCDPFVGGGTTAVVALALGRRFVGCDVDAKCVAQAKQRVEVALCAK
jgi:site-specific DNA-methyltransferase (adenine-specific)